MWYIVGVQTVQLQHIVSRARALHGLFFYSLVIVIICT
jgi:hypothetical protein